MPMMMMMMKEEQQQQLKKSIRCCISCIFPCGAFDVIRIVHSNGHVQEIACTVRAADVMEAHPKHVLKRPSFDAANHHRPTVVTVPPDAHLHRGKIYFLVPAPSVGPTPPPPPKPRSSSTTTTTTSTSSSLSDSATSSSRSTVRKKHHHHHQRRKSSESGSGGNKAVSGRANVGISDQYLSEIMSEKVVSVGRERRRGRVAVWRPHLESICETL